jgi:hypothetical protein
MVQHSYKSCYFEQKEINWFSINLMKANPDKFQAIAIGKKTNKHNLTFNLNGNNITCEDNVKLLTQI